MKIRTDKIEVKVKEEEVKVAEITEEEFTDIAAKANANLLDYMVKKCIRRTGNKEIALQIADSLTDFSALLTCVMSELIYGHDETDETTNESNEEKGDKK